MPVTKQPGKALARRFGNQLSGVLELLAGSLRSGQSLVQALQTAAAEAPQPARAFFVEVSAQVSLGTWPEEALDALAKNFQGKPCVEELRMLSTAVSVTRSTGGNLAQILMRLADTLRQRERLRAEVDAMTAQGKMSGYIVGALPALLLCALWLIDPAMVWPLFTTLPGWGLLGVAAFLETLGAWMISRIVAIED